MRAEYRWSWYSAAVALVAVISTFGCTYGQAIEKGDQHAAKGEWRKALYEYRRAKEARPNSDAAAEKFAKAREKAVGAALDRAATAIEEKRFGDVHQSLEFVQEVAPDHDRGAELHERARSEMASTVRARMEEGETGAAYRLHRAFGKYFPEHTDECPSREEIRRAEFERTDTLAEQGEFERALARLEVVAKNEPERVPGLVERRDSYRKRWVAELRERAKRHREQGHRGATALLRAEAYRVGGDDRDRKASKRFAETLREEGVVAVRLQFSAGAGVVDLPERLVEGLRGRLTKVRGLELSDRGSADLGTSVAVREARCRTEQVGTRQASQRYVADTKQVRNPEYERLERRLEEHRHDIRRIEDQRDQAHHIWHDLEEDLDRFNRDRLQRLRRRYRRLDSQLQDHERLLHRLEGDVESAERRYRRLRRCDDCSRSRVDAARDRVDRLEDRLDDEERNHREARRDLRDMERRYRRLQREYEDLRDEVEEARSEYRDWREKYRRALADEERLERRLDRTPRTRTEKVWDDFFYEVRKWRRSCRRSAVLQLRGEHVEGAGHDIEKSAATTDESHDAHPRYGVEGDPRRFSSSRSRLVASVDQSIAEEGARRVRGAFRRTVRTRVRAALETAEESPHRTTDRVVAAVLAAGPQMGDELREAIEAHVAEQYDVKTAVFERVLDDFPGQ